MGMGPVWVKIQATEDRRFYSIFPFTRVPLRVPIFDPHPNMDHIAES